MKEFMYDKHLCIDEWKVRGVYFVAKKLKNSFLRQRCFRCFDLFFFVCFVFVLTMTTSRNNSDISYCFIPSLSTRKVFSNFSRMENLDNCTEPR